MPADDVRGPPPSPPPDAALSEGTLRRLLSRGLVRAGLITYLFSGLTLVANLVTGVVTARALGPSGRGVTVALTTVSQLTGFLFALGVAQSLSFFIARRPEQGASLLTTWVLMLLPLAATGVALAQLLLPDDLSDRRSGRDHRPLVLVHHRRGHRASS